MKARIAGREVELAIEERLKKPVRGGVERTRAVVGVQASEKPGAAPDSPPSRVWVKPVSSPAPSQYHPYKNKLEKALISFYVEGLPQTKGSTKGFVGRSKKTGNLRAFIVNDNKKNKGWAALVAHEAKFYGPRTPMTGPVSLDLSFFMPSPKRPKHPIFPIVKPDLDKLTRSIKDALKDGGVYQDDAQVCVMTCRKLYATGKPGVAITLKEA